VAQGTGDAVGSFVGKDRWTLDVPGIYRYTLEAEWQGHRGFMPGLPQNGGEFYVIEKERPAEASGLAFTLPPQSTFSMTTGVTLRGTSTAKTINYAAVIPGCVILRGTVPVNNGRFEFTFNPTEINRTTPTYDTVNLVNGRPEVFDVVHLTFFSEETTPTGTTYHSFVRLIIRGSTIHYVR
jgi:hypothetical protein